MKFHVEDTYKAIVILMFLVSSFGCSTTSGVQVTKGSQNMFSISTSQEGSMSAAKTTAIKEASEICSGRNFNPKQIDLGISRGWFLAKFNYELEFECKSATKKSKEIPNTKLFLYRKPGFFGESRLFKVSVDGHLLGTLATNEYLVKSVAPGRHTIKTIFGGESYLSVVEIRSGLDTYAELRNSQWDGEISTIEHPPNQSQIALRLMKQSADNTD